MANNNIRNDGFRKFGNAFIDEKLVKGTFRAEYQRRVVLKALSQNRAALFVEMGLGKTFMIRTVLNHFEAWGLVKKCVVVCPPEGVINFALEFIKFSTSNLTWNDIYIVDSKHRTPFADGGKKLTIMTYRALLMLHDDASKAVKGKKLKRVAKNYIDWGALGDKLCIILDECQNIKNHTSKIWKVADRAKSFFDFRYIMSGTMSTKYACDLWTQMRFLCEAAVPKNYYAFITEVANLGNRFSDWAINYYYRDKVEEFLRHTAPLVIREQAKGNIKLPPVLFKKIYCAEDKTAPCASLVERYAAEGRKIILWSGHPDVIDALCNTFAKYHPYKLHGQTVIKKGESISERNAAVCKAFVEDKKSSLLIASYRCLSTAVNLVEATRQIFWDRSWESDDYIQAVKRSNRIGSTETLVVNDLIFYDSDEDKQYREIEKRLDFNSALWDYEGK